MNLLSRGAPYTLRESMLLWYLRQLNDSTTPAHLGRLLRAPPSAVSRALTRLEGEGLLQRRADPGRKWGVLVLLTHHAERLFQPVIHDPTASDP